LYIFFCQHIANRIQICDLNPNVGMDGFQAFNKLNLPQRHFERRTLAASGLPRSSALEAQGVKKLVEHFEFFGACNVANCGDAFNHFLNVHNYSIGPGPAGSSGGLYSLSSSFASSISCCATCSRTPPITSLVRG